MTVGLAASIVKGSSVVAALGTIGGGALYLDNAHAPMSVVYDMGVSRIFDLVNVAQRDGRADWICRAIEEELIKLCNADPDHYLCKDKEARRDIMRKAECQ